MRHSLPKDPHLRAVWLERIGLSESAAPRSVRVCGRHFPPEAYHYNLEFVQRSAVGMKHLHLKKNTVPTLLLPKTRAQVLVMQVPGASASATAIGPAQANTNLRLLVSAKTQTDAPVVEAVPGEAEPDFEPARTSRVAAAVAVTPLLASFRPARCSSPRLVDEATQGTRGQDMSGDTTLASEGDEMCQTDDPTYDPSDFSLDADFPLGATFSRRMLIPILFVQIALRAHFVVGSTDPTFEGVPESETQLNSQILKKILKEQTKTNKTLALLTNNLKEVESAVGDIQTRITNIEQELCRIEKCEQRLEKVDEACINTSKLVLELVAKVDDLENRSRRNNILVYGVKEDQDEDSEELERKVNEEIFKKILGVEVNSIERIHRIGLKHAERHRPIILRFFNYVDKTKVMSSCFKLKGTKIAISEDFSKNVRDIRAKLWRSAAEEKSSGSKVSLRYDKLKVDDRVKRGQGKHDGLQDQVGAA
ncbi:hypothetical protein HPB48_026423 [Haemaphysalis longicornis]|uniref:THAP-type domain-containing protein n=1 Tax=Haemaphysalis longicornis TaxID=44386 RepID=A0A9J6HC02_HAELO|nr:hypothetical protein HPB48_026423 [Haemaphysalis longicornis]